MLLGGYLRLDYQRPALGLYGRIQTVHKALIAPYLVLGLCVSEGRFLPIGLEDAVADGPKQHIGIAEPRQVQIGCKVLHKLFHRHVVATPEGNAIQFHAQTHSAHLGQQKFFGLQLLAGANGQSLAPLQADFLPFYRAFSVGLLRHK